MTPTKISSVPLKAGDLPPDWDFAVFQKYRWDGKEPTEIHHERVKREVSHLDTTRQHLITDRWERETNTSDRIRTKLPHEWPPESRRQIYGPFTNYTDDEVEARPAPNPRLNPAPNQSDRLKLVPAGEVMQHLGPIDWRVNNLFERDALGTLVGDPGAFKTFIALDAAVCVAAGIPWHGEAVKQGLAIFIAGEGHNGFARRLGALGARYKLDLEALPFFKTSCAVPLTDKKGAAAVERLAKQFADKHGGPAIVVVDTLARNFGDGDENVAADMNRFIDHLDNHLRAPTGATVVVVHHSGVAAKDRGRGSSSLRGGVDFEYIVTKPEPLMATLTNEKMKDAPKQLPRHFRVLSVPLNMEGADSLVLERVMHYTPAKKGKRTAAGKGEHQANVLAVVQAMTEREAGAPHASTVVAAAVDMADAPSPGQKDRRREYVLRAIDTLKEEGELVEIGGCLQFSA